ncbi:acetyltransferase [Psychrobacter jeotgali]|uniref:acetyltransferase n=1 Tax=Psychrobacter jeotgali TaxID=179010 RepID=UPI00191A5AD7|nr:acetyltransferase [Psychrobacter jeotgali]
MRSIYIIGASGFASEISEYISNDNEYSVAGYFDKNKNDYDKYDFKSPFLNLEKDFDFKEGDCAIISIAEPTIKGKIYREMKSRGVDLPTFISKQAYVSTKCIIGEASIICPFVAITSNARIGVNFHANIYSYVAHDCIIGDNVTFAPAVKCNGNVIIEDNVYIGTGAIIFQGKPDKPMVIGENSIIAAGSVVTKSVPKNTTVFGSPAVEFTKENIKRRS